MSREDFKPADWAKECVGKFFRHFGGIYYCDSVVWEGFWMTQVRLGCDEDRLRRTNVSARAIGRTFHELMEWEVDRMGLVAPAEQEVARLEAERVERETRWRSV